MAGFQSSVLDVAFDKIGKKYPSFKRETGRKMIDGLSGVYKSFKNRRQKKESENGSTNPSSEEEMKLIRRDSDRKSEVVEVKCDNDTDKDSNKDKEETQKTDDSDDCDFLTADEDENPDEEKEKKDKTSGDEDDPEKGLKPNETVVDCGPAGVEPHHKPKGVDISQYLQKKSMAQGMLDLALLSANTNQLRYILETRDDNMYFYVSITLIISSLVLQVAVGIMLIWSHRFNMRRRSGMASADRINNLSVLGVFLITLINVFISTFGGSSASGAAPAPNIPVPSPDAPKPPPVDATLQAPVAPMDPGIAIA
ncbi:ninjurin-A-like [Phlebotomus argentipes]|uniref:ninjurin-A-like n=1 Tax=Phlebotomus argentipes TaxID=94469 RepID=UPI002892C913|nr:ninjurin-A-like [Phlebotomus argentipes]